MAQRLAVVLTLLAAGTAILVAATLGTAAAAAPASARVSAKQSNCVHYVVVNQRRSLLRGNTSLRKALNWAVDRTAFAAAQGHAKPLTHLLAPGMAGSRSTRPYPVRPNLAKARQLANGHLRDGSVSVAYQSAGTVGPASAQLLQQALVGLGFDQSRIVMTGFAGFDLYVAAGQEGAPYDLVVGIGACYARRDSATLLRSVLDPKGEWGQYATDSAFYRKKLASISRRLKGRARVAALGRLDIEVMQKIAPTVPLSASSSN